MKKIIAAISAAALVLTLTACNNTENTSTTPNNSTPVSGAADSANAPAAGDSSDVPAGAGDSTSADVPAEPDSSDVPANPDDDPIVVPDDPNNPADPNANKGVDNSGLAFPDNRAGRMVKAALAESAWSYMELADEETLPFLFPDLKLEDMEEYCIAQCPMSAQLQYAVAIKPKAGSEAAVKSVFESFIQAKKDDQMLYPQLQIVAQNAILAEDGGYIYVVLHQEPFIVEDAMTAAQ